MSRILLASPPTLSRGWFVPLLGLALGVWTMTVRAEEATSPSDAPDNETVLVKADDKDGKSDKEKKQEAQKKKEADKKPEPKKDGDKKDSDKKPDAKKEPAKGPAAAWKRCANGWKNNAPESADQVLVAPALVVKASAVPVLEGRVLADAGVLGLAVGPRSAASAVRRGLNHAIAWHNAKRIAAASRTRARSPN
jgi:hypothetical protein